MSRDRRATISAVSHAPRSSSTAPTTCNQEPDEVKQLKDSRRRMTVCGAYGEPCFRLPPQSDTESIKSTTFDSPEQCPSSPAWSFISGASSTSSVKSVQISESNEPIEPGQYAPNTPKPSPKPILKHREVNNARLTSLFDIEAPLMAARAAIESITHSMVDCVKEFKPPTELDFSATTEQQPLVLANSIANKPFTDQLCKLAGLRLKLTEIPTHGDEVLEDMHMAATAAIDGALKRMKEYQMKLFKKAVMESKIAFDNFLETFDETLQSFRFPSELDFPSESDKNGMVLLNTDNNKRFIDQLRKLDRLRVWLEGIWTYGNPDFEQKHDEAYAAVKDATHDMQEHQHKLWKQSIAIKALDNLLRSVIAHVSEFEYPSALDFPANAGNGELSLLNTDRNQKFVNQFHVLQRFRDQLVRIETQGNEQLEKKHKGVSSAIAASLRDLKTHQRELQEKDYQRKLWNEGLDKLLHSGNVYIRKLEYPYTFNFLGNVSNGRPSLPETTRNQKFVNRFYVLQTFYERLATVEMEGRERLEQKYKGISLAREGSGRLGKAPEASRRAAQAHLFQLDFT